MLLAIFFAIIALISGLAILRLYIPFYKPICLIAFISWCFHMFGTLIESSVMSDSRGYYFDMATPHWKGLATFFMQYFVWHIRDLITGDSFVAIIFLFGVLAFLGSILWYCLFLKTADIMGIKLARFYWFPALILMCWPSSLLMSAGMKDSWSYCFVPLFLLSFFSLRSSQPSFANFFLACFAGIMAFLVRPYLVIIFCAGLFFASQAGRQRPLIFKLFIGAIGLVVLLLSVKYIIPMLGDFTGKVSLDYAGVAHYAVDEQRFQNMGTSFPTLTSNPNLMIFQLPYAFIMNLCFPLFILARNALGLLQSFENAFLVFILYFTWKYYKIVFKYTKQVMPLKILFCYFISGMGLLSLLNTNLGAATRIKLMYLPAFLVIYCIVYICYKQQQYEYYLREASCEK